MKKLFLLAVVVLGFAATSLAQTAVFGVGGQIQSPAGTPALTITYIQDMDFGIITNKATSATDVTSANMEIKADGTVAEYNLSHTGTPRVAKFLIKNCTTTLNDTDIKLTGYSDHSLSGTNAFFDTSSAGSPNSYLAGLTNTTNYTGFAKVPGTTDQYNLSIGGVLQMNSKATGGFNVSGLTVTIIGH